MIKDTIRIAMTDIRKDLSFENIYNAKIKVIEQIKFNNDFLNADYVGIYNPVNNEIDLTELLELFPLKKFALPKIINNEIRYILVDKNTEYELNEFNVLDPKEGRDITSLIKFVFVPFLAINDQGHRIGYGKGYFDFFFEKRPNIIRVGIGYYFQKTTFDAMPHDVALSYYILG